MHPFGVNTLVRRFEPRDQSTVSGWVKESEPVKGQLWIMHANTFTFEPTNRIIDAQTRYPLPKKIIIYRRRFTSHIYKLRYNVLFNLSFIHSFILYSTCTVIQSSFIKSVLSFSNLLQYLDSNCWQGNLVLKFIELPDGHVHSLNSYFEMPNQK